MKSLIPVTSTGDNVGDVAALLLLSNVTAELGLYAHTIDNTRTRWVGV